MSVSRFPAGRGGEGRGCGLEFEAKMGNTRVGKNEKKGGRGKSGEKGKKTNESTSESETTRRSILAQGR